MLAPCFYLVLHGREHLLCFCRIWAFALKLLDKRAGTNRDNTARAMRPEAKWSERVCAGRLVLPASSLGRCGV